MAKKLKDKKPKEDKNLKAKENMAAKGKKLHDVADKLQKQWGMPNAQGLVISQVKPAELIDGDLHTWLSAKRQGEELVHDAHFVFRNPPSSVDGEDNPKKALKRIIEDALMEHLGHKL